MDGYTLEVEKIKAKANKARALGQMHMATAMANKALEEKEDNIAFVNARTEFEEEARHWDELIEELESEENHRWESQYGNRS